MARRPGSPRACGGASGGVDLRIGAAVAPGSSRAGARPVTVASGRGPTLTVTGRP
jgi:hypothetical protein